MFWGDLDRRNALNATGVLRLARETSVGIVFRAASGIPLPGYFDISDGKLVVGERRNEIRLPSYMRLDARIQRTLFFSHHRMTAFAEMLNVLNRPNRGIAEGFAQPVTGEALGFSRPLIPRRVSIGIVFDVSR